MKTRLIQLVCLLLVWSSAYADHHVVDVGDAAIIRYNTVHHPVIAAHGMVVSQNDLASEVGRRILMQGGNAVDAAVAVGFALAVTLPRAGNIGGGGFMLLHLAETDQKIAIDYRETAPAAAYRDMYLNTQGDVDNQLAQFSHRSAGVPGTVAGMYMAWSHWGSMPWAELVAPAIELAEAGFTVSYDLSENLKMRQQWLTGNPYTAAALFKAGGEPYEPGELLVQKQLAETLKKIASGGADAFYKGDIADLIVRDMENNQGLIKHKDLADYRPVIRKPLLAEYKEYEILAMPPPSSGGVHVLQMLNVLEHLPITESGANSAKTVHWLAETMRRAYADRSKHLGDPDFYDVPVEWLTSDDYAKTLAMDIDPDKATASSDVHPGVAPADESPDTTHFSIVDSKGNAVANTYTLNFSFGSGLMVEGAGFLLNNEMDDFSAKPGVPNAFGLLGGEANGIQAGKRPLSSMTPVMVFEDGSLRLVTGSPGGSRIITTVFQQLVNVLIFGMNIADATHAPRIHHQWYPDQLELEPGFSPDTIRLLKAMGHQVIAGNSMGSLQSIMVINGLLYGAADPRRPGAAALGY